MCLCIKDPNVPTDDVMVIDKLFFDSVKQIQNEVDNFCSFRFMLISLIRINSLSELSHKGKLTCMGGVD